MWISQSVGLICIQISCKKYKLQGRNPQTAKFSPYGKIRHLHNPLITYSGFNIISQQNMTKSRAVCTLLYPQFIFLDAVSSIFYFPLTNLLNNLSTPTELLPPRSLCGVGADKTEFLPSTNFWLKCVDCSVKHFWAGWNQFAIRSVKPGSHTAPVLCFTCPTAEEQKPETKTQVWTEPYRSRKMS